MSKIIIPKSGTTFEVITMPPTTIARGTPGRKRKLDHLSPDEKIQRKKLKNRVAAQTSRDRKKKMFDELERQLAVKDRRLCAVEKQLSALQTKCDKLERENKKLKSLTQQQQRHQPSHNIPDEHRYNRPLESAAVDRTVGSLTIKSEPAVFAPLPKVTKMESESIVRSHSQKPSKSSDAKSLLKIVLLCLLYKNSSRTSTLTSSTSTWSSLQRACSKMSPESWRRVLDQAKSQMPRVRARNSHALDHWWGPKTRTWNPPQIAVQ